MVSKIYDYKVLLEKDVTGGYVAICPSFQGCYSQGETVEDALDNIKEAIYKCLFPLINEYVDFLEMEVRLDEAAMTFSAQPRAARLDKNLIGRIRGRYTSHSCYVISGAWIS